ncbi:hypothetical protein [Leucobacter iarius]|uniref:Uncharacterized protein n=1 Tax=Leucobacter iarius TaxID=333963 RepID=A0ABN2LRM7_9MICO
MNATTASDQTAPTRPIAGIGAETGSGTETGSGSATDRAAAFADAVRDQLADLPADERDELLDGLEADLVERISDGGEPGDPIAYAEELRRAAGLPPRGEAVGTWTRPTLRERVDAIEARLGTWAESTAARRGIWGFVRSLRPAWWVFRGLGVAFALMFFAGFMVYLNGFPYPRSMTIAVLLSLVTTLLSVQWGRGEWLPKRWMVWLRRMGDVIAVFALVFLLGSIANLGAVSSDVSEQPQGQPGLNANADQRISNIYAYDCSGKLLDGVRLFDQDGRPLTTTTGGPWGDGQQVDGGWDEQKQQSIEYGVNRLADPGAWNVFPLAEKRIDTQGNAVSDDAGPIAAAPRDAVAPLSTSCPAPGATQEQAGAGTSATQTPAPSATPTSKP